MIISASYRTDIPAFYGEWFLNRFRAGYCRTVNPYNPRQHSKVMLGRPHVDGFVFWTKNARPFLPVLEEVRGAGFPFAIQYTINGYPRSLESRVIDPEESVRCLRELAARFGPRSLVWRYDTIVFSTETPRSFHIENFHRMAEQLTGSVDEVVISFMQLYKKTQRNLDSAAQQKGFTWWDPEASEKRDLTEELVKLAQGSGMSLTVCSQPNLVVSGSSEAHCVDADRLNDVGGPRFSAKLKGSRETCGCYESRDIGAYDTCPHGCVYCYAVQNRELALERFKAHDPNSDYLFPVEPLPVRESRQLKLID